MEKTNKKISGNSRRHLLATVSAFALAASGAGSTLAGEPLLWIDIGWQSDQLRDSGDIYALPFGAIARQYLPSSSLTDDLNVSLSHGGEGKLSFRPEGSRWTFSASVRYGRAKGKGAGTIAQTQILPSTSYVYYHTTIPTYAFPYHRTSSRPLRQRSKFFNASTDRAESHLMLDFEAGHDVGLGMFGHGILGAGMRLAELKSVVNIARFNSIPDPHVTEVFQSTHPTLAFFPSSTRTVPWYHQKFKEVWHQFAGSARGSFEFIGAGPSVYWDASAPLFGDVERIGQVSFDWGVNAALLFGKQKNRQNHQTVGTGNCYQTFLCTSFKTHFNDTSEEQTIKRVAVPNLGGFMGISYRVADVKASFGYRVDYFFRAIDTGVAGQPAITRGFAGPFASISLGIGDD